MPNTRYKLRVPASSANLGPGFDALGLALGIYLECRFTWQGTVRDLPQSLLFSLEPECHW